MADDTEEFTIDEIYSILSMEHPDEGDLNKLKELINKEGSAWKDAIPDEFMAKAFPKYSNPVQLGLLTPEHTAKISNIINNLQAIGANETLKHFVNDNNTPNGDSAVTYSAAHALSAQAKLDHEKFDKADEDTFKSCLSAQLETLNVLADLKDGSDEHIVNFASYDINNKNLKDFANRYDAFTERYNAKSETIKKLEHPSRILSTYFDRVDADAEKYQTNIGSNEGNEAPTEQLPENVANFDPNEQGKDTDKSKRNKDYKSRDIKSKDVIDFFYEDIFLYYLNKGTDWVLGHLQNAVDRYAEWCKKSSKALDEAADKMKNEKCRAATKKIAAEYNRVQAVRDAFAGTRDDRKTYMEQLNGLIQHNIIDVGTDASGRRQPLPDIKDQDWGPLNPNSPADKRMIEAWRCGYENNHEDFTNTFRANSQPERIEKMLKLEEQTHDLGYMLALSEWKHECLHDKNLKCLNIEDLSKDKKFQAKVIKYTKMVEAGIAGAMTIDQLNKDTNLLCTGNFIENITNLGLSLEKALDKDITKENFKANPDKKHRPNESDEAYKEFKSFVNDTLSFTQSTQVLKHHEMYEARSIYGETAFQLEQANSAHSEEQRLIGASLAANEASRQALQQRKKPFEKAREKIMGDKKIKNKFVASLKGKVYD